METCCFSHCQISMSVSSSSLCAGAIRNVSIQKALTNVTRLSHAVLATNLTLLVPDVLVGRIRGTN